MIGFCYRTYSIHKEVKKINKISNKSQKIYKEVKILTKLLNKTLNLSCLNFIFEIYHLYYFTTNGDCQGFLDSERKETENSQPLKNAFFI